MKFNASRKINLGNIDPILQFEMEELSVHDCDSPEEATQKLEMWVRERISFWKGSVSVLKAAQNLPPKTLPVQPPLASPPPPAHYVPSTTTQSATTPGGPPAEFNV